MFSYVGQSEFRDSSSLEQGDEQAEKIKVRCFCLSTNSESHCISHLSRKVVMVINFSYLKQLVCFVFEKCSGSLCLKWCQVSEATLDCEFAICCNQWNITHYTCYPN